MISELEIGLVHETGGTRGLNAVPAISIGSREDLELPIDQRHETLEHGGAVFAAWVVELPEETSDLADVAHFGHTEEISADLLMNSLQDGVDRRAEGGATVGFQLLK